MGCWDNGYGGITCDGSADTIGEWLSEKFHYDYEDDAQGQVIFNKIMGNRGLYFQGYNLVKGDYITDGKEDHEPQNIKNQHKNFAFFMGSAYNSKEKKNEGSRYMTMQEYCQLINFCLGSPVKGKVPIPSFVNGNPDQGSAKPSRAKTTSAPPASTTPHKAGELHTLLGVPKDTKIPFTFLDAITKAKIGTTVTNPTQIGKSKIKITGIIKEKSETALFWKRNQKKRTSGRR